MRRSQRAATKNINYNVDTIINLKHSEEEDVSEEYGRESTLVVATRPRNRRRRATEHSDVTGSTARSTPSSSTSLSSSSSPSEDEEHHDNKEDDEDVEPIKNESLRSKRAHKPTPVKKKKKKKFIEEHSDEEIENKKKKNSIMKATKQTNTRPSSSSSSSSESSEEEEDDDDDDDDEKVIERLLACKNLTIKQWKNFCAGIQTTEVTNGSRFVESEDSESDDDNASASSSPIEKEDSHSTTKLNMEKEGNKAMGVDVDDKKEEETIYEERYLVKWHDVSHLHCSWESQRNLEHQDNFKQLQRYFFKKANQNNGFLYSLDERGESDAYFDPAYTQVDRILEVSDPDKDFPEMKRQFLIKWKHLGYASSTYEYECDLISNNIDYETKVSEFQRRRTKPTAKQIQRNVRAGEQAGRKLFLTLKKDNASIVRELMQLTFPNNGRLRSYQAEGVAWMLNSYMQKRGGILADEMGLGKTLQTVSTIDYIHSKLHRLGPYLVIAPLSTLTHWRREFERWTKLNAIVYHGNAEDREYARELDFAYECDAHKSLRRCHPKNYKKWQRTWMVDVVITSPETLLCEDYHELTHVEWEVMVLDEAHRIKTRDCKLRDKILNLNVTHQLLLTGTPIQNNMGELWCLLNVIHEDEFYDNASFIEKFGNISDKETIDELHTLIQPYILRRLKEDVEKSVPPKEETVIEVELTLIQKQFYRALYEKNVEFLHSKKEKNQQSLMNLAMELRKCCNHTFLIKNAEEECRARFKGGNEGDFLVHASGKLVLLDKLLPYLQANGHRVLMFSQFKIMLDIIEDYLVQREYKFERIDGGVTGLARQKAIDRFQAPMEQPHKDHSNAPFIMLITTKAGGVGINLTAADTCVIFDSDWNPQNDLQAQARCHRIGQTKQVKVYRLISKKTYEMQMFHMASLKMGLDQAVLNGIENSKDQSEGGLSKEEVEKLLRHGAYEIFSNKENDNSSHQFVEASIESILASHSRKIVHENGNQKGGTFSKASFKTDAGGQEDEVDIDDPEFWMKMIGEVKKSAEMEENAPHSSSSRKKRRRRKINYSESAQVENSSSKDDDFNSDDASASSGDDQDSDDDNDVRSKSKPKSHSKKEETEWGNVGWSRNDAIRLVDHVQRYGYFNSSSSSSTQDEAIEEKEKWMNHLFTDIERNRKKSRKKDLLPEKVEVERMCWSLYFYSMTLIVEDSIQRRMRMLANKQQLHSQNKGSSDNSNDVGIPKSSLVQATQKISEDDLNSEFARLLKANANIVSLVIRDMNAYALNHDSRSDADVMRALNPTTATDAENDEENKKHPLDVDFGMTMWPSLNMRSWCMVTLDNNEVNYQVAHPWTKQKLLFNNIREVLTAVVHLHPELAQMAKYLLTKHPEAGTKSISVPPRMTLVSDIDQLTRIDILQFLRKYAPMQLVSGYKTVLNATSSRKVVNVCALVHLLKNCPKSVSASLSLQCTGKPHKHWTATSDSALCQAILKHGWCDHKDAYNDLVSDVSITWGTPFVLHGNKGRDVRTKPLNETQSEAEVSRRLETGKRVKEFLATTNPDLNISRFRNFNIMEVCRIYGIVETSSLVAEETSPVCYSIDETKLRQGLKSSGSDDFNHKPEPLPARHILAKRAKHLIPLFIHSKSNSLVVQNTTDCYLYPRIDHVATPNEAFLYNLVNAYVGLESKELSSARLLLDLCKKEAHMLFNSCPDSDDKRSKDLYRRIEKDFHNLQQVADLTCQNSIQRKIKNAARVMIGLDPVPPQKLSSSSLTQAAFQMKDFFPLEEIRSLEVNLNGSNGMKKASIAEDENNESHAKKKRKRSKKESKSSIAETFMSKAISAYKKNVRRSSSSVSLAITSLNNNDNGGTLDITPFESLLLSVVVSQGFPVFDTNWIGFVEEVGSSMHDLQLTFPAMTYVLINAAQEWVKVFQIRHAEAAYKLEELKRNGASSGDLVKAINAEASASDALQMKKELLAHSEDRVKDKYLFTLSMIEFITKVSNAGRDDRKIINHGDTLANNGLGNRVLDWFRKQLKMWNSALKNKCAAFSSKTSNSSTTKAVSESCAASLDKKACRAILSQIAQQTRLRSIMIQNDAQKFSKMLSTAIRASERAKDFWENRPSWWSSRSATEENVKDDYNLLTNVVSSGYSNLNLVQIFGERARLLPGESLTVASIQSRVYHLTRELAIQQETEEMTLIVEQNRARNSSMRSAEKRNDGGTKVCDPITKKKAKACIQPTLGAYFKEKKISSGPISSKKPEVIEIDVCD